MQAAWGARRGAGVGVAEVAAIGDDAGAFAMDGAHDFDDALVGYMWGQALVVVEEIAAIDWALVEGAFGALANARGLGGAEHALFDVEAFELEGQQFFREIHPRPPAGAGPKPIGPEKPAISVPSRTKPSAYSQPCIHAVDCASNAR